MAILLTGAKKRTFQPPLHTIDCDLYRAVTEQGVCVGGGGGSVVEDWRGWETALLNGAYCTIDCWRTQRHRDREGEREGGTHRERERDRERGRETERERDRERGRER
eukprot:COSAG02_NODE_254_length_26937_cov_16.503950_10_plen_107_part_00